MTVSDPLKQAWQAAGGDMPAPRLDDVRAGADLFHRRIRRRNGIEYAAALIVLPFFAHAALTVPSATVRAGAILAIFGILVIAWQLHRRASAVMPPDEAPRPLIAHQRAQLARQRDALASVGTWYLLPLIPGLGLIALAPAVDGGMAGLRAMSWFQLAWIGIVAAFFVFVWWLNHAAARMLQAEIDMLDALEGETE